MSTVSQDDEQHVRTQNGDAHQINNATSRILGRRKLLAILGSTGAAALLTGGYRVLLADSTIYLPVVNNGDPNGTIPPSATATTTSTPTSTATSVPTATSTATASPTPTSAVTAWSSGSTDLITVDYPDESIFDVGNTCSVSLTQDTTLGPCYFEDDTGEDISLGLTGLPMQLCLRLVDAECQPLPNYTIEIWHCDTEGIYSGDTSQSADASRFAGNFCTGGDSAAAQSTWYRGKLTTDSNGRVNFKTCFPGWYRGRTIHIHFAVSDNGGSSRGVISQFCFTDEFAREICTTHDRYMARGEQDTTLAGGRDTVFPSSSYESFLLTTEQNPDGTLLAYHTIQIS